MPKKVKDASKEGHQKHLVRLSHNDMILKNVGDSRPEIVFINSHDGTSSARFLLGVYRLVCSNGLIVGNTFGGFRVTHIGNDVENQIDKGLNEIVKQLPLVAEKINQFSHLQLSDTQTRDFANEAAKLILPDNAASVNLDSVLRVRRMGDRGQDLWSTYNKAQETLIRGGLRYVASIVDHETKVIQMRPNTSRAIKSIDRQVEVNQALWDLANQFAA